MAWDEWRRQQMLASGVAVTHRHVPKSHWREAAMETIVATLRTLPADTPREVARHALSQAYPFDERRYWPYKVWLNAVKDALTALYGRQQ